MFHKKTPPPPSCVQEDGGEHNWGLWQTKEIRVTKTYTGFGSEVEFLGTVIEQGRQCKRCNFKELNVQG